VVEIIDRLFFMVVSRFSCGSWFNSNQSGHGFTLEVLVDSQVLVYWFTYDAEGNQAWIFGVGVIDGNELVISEALRTRGPIFGLGYNPTDLELIPWGQLRFDLSCLPGSVSYDGTTGGFGAANLELSRLSILDGLTCEG